MSFENENARIYLTDCGCVRIETKHSRTTMTIDKLREFAREFKRRNEKPNNEFGFSKRLSLKNNVRSEENSGFLKGNRF